MPKIYELARDLGKPSKEIIEFLKSIGVTAKTHVMKLDDDAAQKVRDRYAKPKDKKFTVIRQKASPAEVRLPSEAAPPPPPKPEPAPPSPEAVSPTPATAQGGATPSKPAATVEAKSAGAPATPSAKAAAAPPPPEARFLLPEKLKKPEKAVRKVEKTRLVNRDIKEQTLLGLELARGQREQHAPSVRGFKKTEVTTPKASKRRIKLHGAVQIVELAKRMSVKANEVIKKLLTLGVRVTNLNQTIDGDAAMLVAQEFGFEIENLVAGEESPAGPEAESVGTPEPRAPVVTIMGHVDHGKTSLLDAIRQSHVAEKEAGGITQHIGAYRVMVKDKSVVFLDTPGHEAFTEIRARGAKVTDLVVLVVGADDGAMPQTYEAIDHAKAAGVPIIVALNKMDKATANANKVMQQLAERGLTPEEWGGETLYARVSAKQNKGIDELLEKITLQAEVLDLKAIREGPARGTIIESRLDKATGPVATVLIQHGCLSVGQTVLCGMGYGRVKAMTNELGQRVKEAVPSTPVEIVGIGVVPIPGEVLVVMEDERRAAEIAALREQKFKENEARKTGVRPSIQELLQQGKDGGDKELRVIVKADVQGSLEALRKSLGGLNEAFASGKVRLNIIRSAVGNVSANDIMLASASKALVVGFNVRTDTQALAAADREKVELLNFNIIYELLSKMESLMKEQVEPTYRLEVIGHAEVRQVFKISTVGLVAGCFVRDGKVTRVSQARVIRENAMIYEGKMGSLKRFKDEAREVPAGLECGIALANFHEVRVGDLLEFYIKEEIPVQ